MLDRDVFHDVTLDDQPQLRELVKRYQDALRPLPNLDLIPPRWLHLTTQGIGFADEISPADLADVTAAVQKRLRGLEPPAATFHRATLRPEAVLLKAEPPPQLYQLRLALYDAIASALGPDKFTGPRPEPQQFTPHVSAAYVNDDGPAEPIAQAISHLDSEPVTATFHAVSLLEFHRDRRMYEWTSATPLPIGPQKLNLLGALFHDQPWQDIGHAPPAYDSLALSPLAAAPPTGAAI